jgi:hypothetical protein
MTTIKQPNLPLPEPLRGAEIGTFAHNTITVRMPNIARRTLAENDFPPDVVANVEALIDEIANGRIRPLTDKNDWDGYTAVYEGQDWLTPPWFFCETYFYRRILEATGYFGSGPTAGQDPFAAQKQQGLTTTMPATRALAARLADWLAQGWHESTFASLLAIDLWGNQADLSLWPSDAGEKPDHADSASQQEHLLSDDTTVVTHHLKKRLETRRLETNNQSPVSNLQSPIMVAPKSHPNHHYGIGFCRFVCRLGVGAGAKSGDCGDGKADGVCFSQRHRPQCGFPAGGPVAVGVCD